MYRFSAIAIVSFFSLFIALTPAVAQDGKLSEQDKKFVEEAASGSMMEVRLGELAGEKAESQKVKEFGQRMVSDHSKANEKLKGIAQQNNLSLPKELNPEHQKLVDKLAGLSGKEFDREYMNEMVKDHHKDIQAFEKQSQQGQHPELKQFASNTVKTLEEHGQLAEEINRQVSAQAGKTADSQVQASKIEAKKAQNWIGRKINGRDGEELGTVKNNYLSEDENTVLYVIVQGESEKMHPVPADRVRENPDKNELTAEIDKKMFDQSPNFGETEQPELDNQDWSQEIRSFYQGQEKESGQSKKQ
jgi:putative membrane protein